jgi:pimeloyl-ACP methyl ester carboxylesterase
MPYDEFGLFSENAAEYGLPYSGPPAVRRVEVEVGPGRHLSSLVWGTSAPELVLIHGGAQNAHTWDTVAMVLDRPLVAIDLPGHGHSDGGLDGSLSVAGNGADLAAAIAVLAPDAVGVVGMSLGGLSSDELLARTVEHNPGRSESSLRRGILHNALQREDGSWVWRYARFRAGESGKAPEFGNLWDAVSALTMPLMLVRGLAWSVVDDADVTELLRRQPTATVVGVEGAGHSIQGDRPVELASILSDFLFPSGG